ncbi:hydrogenase maturation protease [Sulfurovum sp. bin170]|uniref:hydrogenase maturation protease n=1 Tax=Sulfurovum sp. bin170 TaxID=2695268 RepID=UPI0013E0E869|nr:hydrogenase maturation protease [Sulfurovum sp. bin170]NEW61363.1 hydrogenase maturation protease [Sulfurovum sp. bin170]
MKNIVIGLGNILFYDDGIGVFTALYLEKNFIFEPSLTIIDGGTLGIGLIDYFAEYDNVFIIDTISVDDEAGSIYVLPSDELLGLSGQKNTAHEVEVVDMLQRAMLLDKRAEVTIFSIIPQNIEKIEIGLSKVLEDKFELFIAIIIEKLDIKVMRKEKQITLSNLLEKFR